MPKTTTKEKEKKTQSQYPALQGWHLLSLHEVKRGLSEISGSHEHHIYDGPNRQNSEAEGLKVYLCLDHHIMGPEAVHNNHKNMRILHRDGQRAYERTHSRAEFMSLIGRNYLDEEKQEEPKKDTKDGSCS